MCPHSLRKDSSENTCSQCCMIPKKKFKRVKGAGESFNESKSFNPFSFINKKWAKKCRST